MELTNVDITQKEHDLEVADALIQSAYKKSCNGDWTAINDIEPLKMSGAYFIHQVALESITHNLIACWHTEKDVYEWFRDNYKTILGDAFTIVRKKNDPKHIPDFWVQNNTEEIPVECKLYEFTSQGLRQLQRYMNYYNAEHGIAVGSECRCELPSNITFIQYDIHKADRVHRRVGGMTDEHRQIP